MSRSDEQRDIEVAPTKETPTAAREQHWRSLDQRSALTKAPRVSFPIAGQAPKVDAHREFPEGTFDGFLADRTATSEPGNERAHFATTADLSGVSRRRFLGLAAGSAAVATTAGCIRKPVEKIVAYNQRPEDLIPGEPNYYASAFQSGNSVYGILVESHNGRPTKIEGNPRHPINGNGGRGTTDLYAQASVLDVYDANRSQSATQGEEARNEAQVTELMADLAGRTGGMGVLVPWRPSPTMNRLLGELKQKASSLRLYRHDVAHSNRGREARAALGMPNTHALYALDKVDVVVSLDADFLATESDALRNAALWADNRRQALRDPNGTPPRLYSIDPRFTVTSMSAEHRLPASSPQVSAAAVELAKALGANGKNVESGVLSKVSALATGESVGADFIKAAAKDLASAGAGKALVVAGERQPIWVHALAHAMNEVLGANGKAVQFVDVPAEPEFGDLQTFVADLSSGTVKTAVILGGNPVYASPADLDVAAALGKAELSVHLGHTRDETAAACTWHLPQQHYLEAWGDLRANEGTATLQQPLISPLYKSSISDIEFVARIGGAKADAAKGYNLVQATWKSQLGSSFESTWRKSLHDGVVAGTTGKPSGAKMNTAGIANILTPITMNDGLTLELVVDNTVMDGRYSNNAWLQELPDPVTKLTWDNAALIAPSYAEANGLSAGDMATVSAGGKTLEIAVWPTPGVAKGSVVVALGYGRTNGGTFATGAGFNGYALQGFESPAFTPGASVAKGSGTYALASTQDHGSMEGRPIVREADIETFRKKPEFATEMHVYEVMDEKNIDSLLADEPPRNEAYKQQWGMVIDLDTCTGCNACTIACQAENNIAVVGKKEVLNGREMHWIRLDRYFLGEADNPRAVTQPLGCAHCETAPCETVCPVGATIHSPEGMNDMAYNRCIGTRYCANNCPFKVRRFNFFNFTKRTDEAMPLAKMQRNPDVTVRFRGVMEKCTYCVQRVQAARIDAKVDGKDIIIDGGAVPACAQACPSNAIVFGDIDDESTQVSKLKSNPRNYVMLRELNIRPRTSFLAKVRNPNPELV